MQKTKLMRYVDDGHVEIGVIPPDMLDFYKYFLGVISQKEYIDLSGYSQSTVNTAKKYFKCSLILAYRTWITNVVKPHYGTHPFDSLQLFCYKYADSGLSPTSVHMLYVKIHQLNVEMNRNPFDDGYDMG